ncbi:hypothetical protein PIB30_076607 [Stylosanthes scabra]|uniref:Uncharacterized protein n=1 Tax=Stylosanthes scabra TaxID=79078 RepID=A0ABU6ZP10_9FABA|nr:hypothetical protein [Stylosanthes scabra]
MSGTNAKNDGSDPSGLVVSTASAQSAAAVSTSIGSTRSSTEIGQKQIHDGNHPEVTAGGSLNSGANKGGNTSGRGPHPRFEPPPSNPPPTGGWPPFGMPLNYTPATVPLDTRGTSSSSVQFAAVRELIEESHLDLVNLLTSHLTTELNPTVADTNAKYEHLAKRFDSVIGVGDEENSDPYIPNDGIMHETFEPDHNSENNEIPIPEQCISERKGWRKAWRKLRKDKESKERRKKAKKRRELTPRARALHSCGRTPKAAEKGGQR